MPGSRRSAAIAALAFAPPVARFAKSTTTVATAHRPTRMPNMRCAYSDKTEIQRDITEMVRQFVDEQILPNAEKYDHEDSFPEPIVEQMKELGPMSL